MRYRGPFETLTQNFVRDFASERRENLVHTMAAVQE